MKALIIMIEMIFIVSSAIAVPSDSIFVIISGDTVNVWNTGAHENCACLFRMDVALSNDTIYVTEVDTATTWAYCLCYFDLCASVTGLQSGNYIVEIYRKFLLDPDSVYYIGSTSFTYPGSVLAFISHSYQSDCYNVVEADWDNELPTEFTLEQNFPNPFNPSTTISWQSPVSSWQTLMIYDVLGREVATLINEYKPAGRYEVEFDSQSGLSGIKELPTGIYFYQLKAGEYIQTKKMLLIK